MAFIYTAGLRIRTPEPPPECIAGESPQDYFSRFLGQCSIESATTAENTSGDSAPTPFNVGQVQHDLAEALAAIEGLGTDSGTQQVAIDALSARYANGVGTYALGDTQTVVPLPSEGVWRIEGIVPLTQALATPFVSDITISSFILNFGAAGAAGSFHWSACRVS